MWLDRHPLIAICGVLTRQEVLVVEHPPSRPHKRELRHSRREDPDQVLPSVHPIRAFYFRWVKLSEATPEGTERRISFVIDPNDGAIETKRIIFVGVYEVATVNNPSAFYLSNILR